MEFSQVDLTSIMVSIVGSWLVILTFDYLRTRKRHTKWIHDTLNLIKENRKELNESIIKTINATRKALTLSAKNLKEQKSLINGCINKINLHNEILKDKENDHK